ncbi:hypothetical protein TPENAI_60600 [Tenacibaculum litopenaei]|uniref:PilN domain-containing protein n=1 Tax=Tenacibaculum litopenaei TaxID=396016 RepID=UPI00389465F8
MLRKLVYGSEYCAIEHGITAEGTVVFYLLLLRQSKKELELVTQETKHSEEEVTSFLKERKIKQVVLVVNNQQVLTKWMRAVKEGAEFVTAYPSLSKNDFYRQSHRVSGHHYVAFARKAYIDELLKFYEELQVTVLDVHLGNRSFFEIQSFFTEQEQVFTSNTAMNVDKEEVTELVGKRFYKATYDVNGLTLENTQLLNLGIVVSFYLKGTVVFDTETVEDFKYKRGFQIGIKVVLGFVFAVLLANLFYFNEYYEEVTALKQRIQIKRAASKELAALQEEVVKKEQLLEQIQNSATNTLSKFVDEIAAAVPNSLLLSKVNYQNFTSSLKEGKAFTLDANRIEVKGLFTDYTAFNAWIDHLERKEWIVRVTALETKKEKKGRGSKFSLSIVLH